MMKIRQEGPEDVDAIRLVNELAFGRPVEADIVERLRKSCDSLLSLVAAIDRRVVGHILFSPVTVETDGSIMAGMGLAPLAVIPEYQRQGIGSKLVNEGLRILRSSPCPFVTVVGHADYYERFGFETASKHGVRSQWRDVPTEAFLIVIVDESMINRISGVARYRSEFDDGD